MIPSDQEAPREEANEHDVYADLRHHIHELYGDPVTRHHLLGYADPIQDDMQLDCQLVSHGLLLDSPRAYKDPRAAELAEGARNWRLLLQIDSDDATKMDWGDGGAIYFWIEQAALAAREFDKVWLVNQCH